jgi:AcrR family transcriptional regulator
VNSPAVARGQVVRRRLLEAATELVPERGWSAVSTRILAERAGVTPSVVHYHFPSVRALLAEAALAAMREVAGALDAVLDAAATPQDVVGVLLGSVEQYTGTDPMSLLFIEAYLAATRDEQLRQGISEILAELRSKLARRLAVGGVPDPDGTAAVLAAAIDGLLLHRALSPGAVPAAPVLNRLILTDNEKGERS